LKIIHEKCDPKLADNRKLPYTAYLVEYEDDGKVFYDITISQKAVEMFDYYYDKYKKGLKGWKQTAGIISPKLWDEDMLNPDKKKTSSKKPNQKKRL
tara:strand:+ start:579 stop:869 length:291 start_codon:yes stop_codon:yes gene_type:complete